MVYGLLPAPSPWSALVTSMKRWWNHSSRVVARLTENAGTCCLLVIWLKVQEELPCRLLSDINALWLLSSCPLAHTELPLSNCHSSLSLLILARVGRIMLFLTSCTCNIDIGFKRANTSVRFDLKVRQKKKKGIIPELLTSENRDENSSSSWTATIHS